MDCSSPGVRQLVYSRMRPPCHDHSPALDFAGWVIPCWRTDLFSQAACLQMRCRCTTLEQPGRSENCKIPILQMRRLRPAREVHPHPPGHAAKARAGIWSQSVQVLSVASGTTSSVSLSPCAVTSVLSGSQVFSGAP